MDPVKASCQDLGIILKLEGIEAQEGLARTEDHLQITLIFIKVIHVTPFLHDFFRDIHGVDECGGNLLGKQGLGRHGIGEKGKKQTLHKRAHLSCYRAEIDRGAQNQGIGCLNFLQDGPQIILHRAAAIAFAADGFAFETADTSREF